MDTTIPSGWECSVFARLSSLLGLHFVDWLKYQRVEQYFQEHPEELVGESAATFERLKRRKYTDKFRAVCANVLSELDK